jgi:endoglucanase
MLKRSPFIVLFFVAFNAVFAQKLQLNELGYFETKGLNVLVFSNQYNGFFFDEKTAGIELIHHGVRTATGGAVRLNPTPEQWDLVPMVSERTVDTAARSIRVTLRYAEYDFNSTVHVSAKDEGVLISVSLDKPLPQKLEGHAGFNLEFLPASYFEKTYLVDGKAGVFPLYPSGPMIAKPVQEKIPQFGGYTTFDDRGRGEFVEPLPLATGSVLVLAPEDPERTVTILCPGGELRLYDGRNVAQNGWYVVRSLMPAGKTGKVLEWHLKANTIENWKRAPVIGFSQVGYHPSQEKRAVIELDKHDTPLKTASLYQVLADGRTQERLNAEAKPWGRFLRYNYVTFDFSSVKDSGVYFIKYGDQKTNAFTIGTQVYNNVWHQTLDVWFPVQMDHMFVNEAYRVWHGAPFRDDALQAPINVRQFDGYWMDSTTHTKYKPLERIPGLDVGGWFDAGDFDIETGHHGPTILSFVDSWEQFGLKRDETLVDQKGRYVDIHHPDGKPDLLQQIEHGTLQLVAQYKNIGFAVRGINFRNLHQYHHLGDASTITDNLPYNPKLKPYESDGLTSGTPDDRWVFTIKIPFINYSSIGALAAASRALKGYNPQLSEEALFYAIKGWDDEHTNAARSDTARNPWFFGTGEAAAALQLYITTKDKRYAKAFEELLWKGLDNGRTLPFNIPVAARAVPYMGVQYKDRLRTYVVRFRDQSEKLVHQNPYGVIVGTRSWAGNSELVSWSITNFFLHKAYPDLINRESVLKGLNYVFGCHPYSNISFVAGVGTHSKKVMYGNNRADFSFIAGGVVPGVLLLKPDFLENKEDWPFLWGENECVIDICADYIFLANAVNDLLTKANNK